MTVLMVSELFVSIQGESSFAGLPCAFLRLAGCPGHFDREIEAIVHQQLPAADHQRLGRCQSLRPWT
jgi:organic radical activating enzyme